MMYELNASEKEIARTQIKEANEKAAAVCKADGVELHPRVAALREAQANQEPDFTPQYVENLKNHEENQAFETTLEELDMLKAIGETLVQDAQKLERVPTTKEQRKVWHKETINTINATQRVMRNHLSGWLVGEKEQRARIKQAWDTVWATFEYARRVSDTTKRDLDAYDRTGLMDLMRKAHEAQAGK